MHNSKPNGGDMFSTVIIASPATAGLKTSQFTFKRIGFHLTEAFLGRELGNLKQPSAKWRCRKCSHYADFCRENSSGIL